ncbi:hypothetical protein [Clostridium botulinum]|uniref:hypothetical protein n=1 Tax=Clostridium botulinum TaxID=1491 RepID=UPI0004D560DC|nr:hypothetical protein [Clostridium botulinum]KEI01533.1 hypothetical protein Z952_11790 [Clostridium botulinum C/D str. BKT75002]KEI07867.1 hypothetical protein Z954_02925 [Clostridium botulinum C/D str. BKT2873]MCD3349525.1 hypothetical protein [Clostridium botulinum D/C]MCD3358484.1 hypothetical protein [Clostridium botulinum D/C]MCD3362977.1 hypothetical protein [Clostridium botulinum D/C]
MIFLVIIFYGTITTYGVLYLTDNNLKNEIPIYAFIMSISIIISSLEALGIRVPDPMMYFSKFLEMIVNFLGRII